MNSYNKNGILIGMLLGDGGAFCNKSKTGNGKLIGNARIQITHSSKQYEYLYHKESLLKEMGFRVTIHGNTFKDKRFPDRTYANQIIQTNRHESITRLQRRFYGQDRTKHVTKSLLNRLTDHGLAIWFMDDGSLRYIKKMEKKYITGLRLHTEGYLEQEQDLIINWFLIKHGIDCKKYYTKKHWCLYFSKDSAKKLVTIIKPYLIDTMLYKFEGLYSVSSENEDKARALTTLNKCNDIVCSAQQCADVGIKSPTITGMQIPPFDVVLAANNEYGASAKMIIFGVEIN